MEGNEVVKLERGIAAAIRDGKNNKTKKYISKIGDANHTWTQEAPGYSFHQVSALHIAVYYRQTAIATMLMELGADPNLCAEGIDNYGRRTCTGLAKEMGLTDIDFSLATNTAHGPSSYATGHSLSRLVVENNCVQPKQHFRIIIRDRRLIQCTGGNTFEIYFSAPFAADQTGVPNLDFPFHVEDCNDGTYTVQFDADSCCLGEFDIHVNLRQTGSLPMPSVPINGSPFKVRGFLLPSGLKVAACPSHSASHSFYRKGLCKPLSVSDGFLMLEPQNSSHDLRLIQSLGEIPADCSFENNHSTENPIICMYDKEQDPALKICALHAQELSQSLEGGLKSAILCLMLMASEHLRPAQRQPPSSFVIGSWINYTASLAETRSQARTAGLIAYLCQAISIPCALAAVPFHPDILGNLYVVLMEAYGKADRLEQEPESRTPERHLCYLNVFSIHHGYEIALPGICWRLYSISETHPLCRYLDLGETFSMTHLHAESGD